MLGLGIAISLIGLAYTVYELATRPASAAPATSPAADPRQPGGSLKPRPALPRGGEQQAQWMRECHVQSGDFSMTEAWTTSMFSNLLPLATRVQLAESAVPLVAWPDYAVRVRCYLRRSLFERS